MAVKKKKTLKGLAKEYMGSNDKKIIDVINVYGSHCTVRARNGNDVINIKRKDKFEDMDNHQIDGGGGKDKITLTVGSWSKIYGGSGNDTIIIEKSSKNENNDIYGEAGNDKIIIKGGNNNHLHKVHGGTGNDIITVTGGKEYDIYGDKGTDTFNIKGGGYWNNYYGGAGVDTFNIKGGTDNYITGGSGLDKYVFYSSFKGDAKICDYTRGEIIKFNKGASYSVSDGISDLVLNGKGTLTIEYKGYEKVPVTIQNANGKIETISFD